MNTKVKFFCKLRINSDKKTRVVIHSICRTVQSFKYKFRPEDQELSKHLAGVKAVVLAANVKSKRHVDYTLKGKEVDFYLDPETSKFWFNGLALEKVSADSVTNQPSEDKEDELVPSTSQCSSLVRQEALETDSSDLVISPTVLKKVACCKTLAQKTGLLREVIGEYDFCKMTPNNWIKKFEQSVRSCLSNPDESDLDHHFLSYLPYFLQIKYRSWFFGTRQEDDTWPVFKKKFFTYFWAKYWAFVEKTLQGEPEEGCSLRDFVKAKIDDLKRLLPELSERSVIMHCILELPEETRPHLQDGISESIEMFLSMVEAVDFQFGRAKRNFDSDDEDASPWTKKVASSTVEKSSSLPTLRTPAATSAALGNSDPLQTLLARMDQMEATQSARVQEIVDNQASNMENYVSSAFTSPQFEKLIFDILAKKK